MTIQVINANPYGFLSNKKLNMFERKVHVRLPSDYRNFLLQYNGGKPTPSFFWIQPNADGSRVYQFYGLHDGPVQFSIETFVGRERYGIPASLMPIGDDGIGNFICIGTSTENFGKVYFLDHDEHPSNNPNSSEGIIKLANSFTEFMHSLADSPE